MVIFIKLIIDSIAGNEIKDYGLEDSYKNWFVVERNNPIKKEGMIDNFDIFSRTQNPLRLLIYRAESELQFPLSKESINFIQFQSKKESIKTFSNKIEALLHISYSMENMIKVLGILMERYNFQRKYRSK